MIRQISKHAWLRIEQRQKSNPKHRNKILHKMQKWSLMLPDDADYYRKGYKYIVRDGTLITMYYWGRGGVKKMEG